MPWATVSPIRSSLNLQASVPPPTTYNMEIGEFVPSPDNEKVPMNIKPGKWNLYLNGEQIATMDAEMIPTFENIGNIGNVVNKYFNSIKDAEK